MALVNLAARWSLAPDTSHSRAVRRMAESLGRPATAQPDRRCWLDAHPCATFDEAVRAESARAVVIADTRLLNPDNLARRLGSPWPASDAQLLLEAWEQWGAECPAHLEGDFAFVIWDKGRQELLAARDLFGVRGLMVGHQPGVVAVGSRIETVLAGLDKRPQLNSDFLRDVLVGSPRHHPHGSPYMGVDWLRPGHKLVVRDGHVAVSRYAAIEPRGAPPTSRARAVAQLREALTAAVERRLPGTGAAGVMVSGGFDSSSILLLAQQAVTQGRYSGPLRSYSATFERMARADEREYVAAVLSRCPSVVPTLVPWDDEVWSLERLGPADGLSLLDPPLSARSFSMHLAGLAAQHGCHAILKGNWADQLLLRHPTRFSRLMSDLPLDSMVRALPAFSRSRKLGALVGLGVFALDRVRLSPGGASGPGNRRYRQYLQHSFVNGRHAAAMNYYDRLARLSGLEHRYPYLDAELHSLMLGMPTTYMIDGLRPKPLLADAMADLLPPVFHRRTTFGFVGAVTTEGARNDATRIKRLLTTPRVVDQGLIKPRALARALAPLDGTPSVAEALAVQRVVAVEWALELYDAINVWYS